MNGTLIVAEHVRGELRDVTCELVTAAQELGDPVAIAVIARDASLLEVNFRGVDDIVNVPVEQEEFENDVYQSALEVLIALHKAKLTTLPVRERLARAAARTGAWTEATRILEELMQERPERDGRIEAARLSVAIHRDRLHAVQGAVPAVTRLLEEAPARLRMGRVGGDAVEAL